MTKFLTSTLCFLLFSSLIADIKKVEIQNTTSPLMIHRNFNPAMGLNLQSTEDDKLLEVTLKLAVKNPKTIKEIAIYRSLLDKNGKAQIQNKDPKEKLGSISGNRIKKGKCVIKCKGSLKEGNNYLWLSITPSEKASLKKTIKVSVTKLKTKESKNVSVKKAECKQRVGYAITVPSYKTNVLRPKSGRVVEKRVSKYSRIPGLTCTQKGTLIAVFDNRYGGNGDLPGDIDCAVSRSTDGGQTWSPVTTCLAARDIEGIGRGVGDPAILLDEKNNRIWVAALAAPKTGHPIWKSETGTTSPDRCGQLVLTYSDDEGKTWSKPMNITESVKRLQDADTKKWALLFNGPGNGICMRDGTLVFPGQVWGHKGKGSHWGVLVYSKDNGKTWQSSKAMTFGGSESQVAELSDGSLMLNTREGAGGNRQVGVTKDMGETWEKHESLKSREGRLRNPFCQACLISVFNPKPTSKDAYKFGKKKYKHLLFFSNPNAGSRREMTLKYSKDDGKTWNKGLLYDQRNGMGYSAIYPIDKKYLGVFYESQHQYLQFIKLKYTDILQAN